MRSAASTAPVFHDRGSEREASVSSGYGSETGNRESGGVAIG
jgi:hypothetical protein